MKAVAIGERHLILGFQGVGFDLVPVGDADSPGEALARVARRSEVGLVLVTEGVAARSPEALREFRSRSRAVLCVIPTGEGGARTAAEAMRREIERSVGIDVLGRTQVAPSQEKPER